MKRAASADMSIGTADTSPTPQKKIKGNRNLSKHFAALLCGGNHMNSIFNAQRHR
jgi:hypothetical protein